MAQLNMLVGDIAGNTDRLIAAALRARDEFHADAVVFTELALTGYPPEDLLLRPDFHRQVLRGIAEIRRRVAGIDVIFGYPRSDVSGLSNAASVVRNGQIVATYHKQHLPNYSVFDEKRYFVSDDEACVFMLKGVPIGITICEDVWMPDPIAQAVAAGAKMIVNLNASPFHAGKGREREHVVRSRIKENHVPIVYVNQVGGQDELVFDGESFVMNAAGEVTQRACAFDEGLFPVDFVVRDGQPVPASGTIAPPPGDEASVYGALVLGVRDYIEKNHFPGVVLGLSGGVDSALTLAIAVDAIGAHRIEAVMMPSRYTSDISQHDAQAQALALGVEYHVISIEPPFRAFLDSLAKEFAGKTPDVTEENIQARCRGIILMAISNKTGKMLLTTGNKSEMSVGYATLYGDMAGGFAPLKDVPKTMVYRLATYRNGIAPVIPARVMTRAPSAELAPDQKDEDSLPPYSILDPILEMYIEQDKGPDEIIAAGYDAEIVKRVIAMVSRNEYKRRQAPPGVRVTRRAFGRDRRYPITSGYQY